MRRSRNNMDVYRGRRTVHDVLKTIAAVLAVLVLLVLLGLFFGQEYIFYSEDGLRVELPFFSQDETREDPVDPDSLNMTEEDKSAQKPEEEDTSTPSAKSGRRILELPLDAILDGSAPQKLKEAGADGVVVTMKARSGQLSWQSQQALALNSKVNSTIEGINDKLKTWNQGDIYTVARVVCFPDDAVPYYNGSAAIRLGKGNWRDPQGSRWLDPTRAKARDYVAGLCGELAQLGFDEILLEETSCPLMTDVPLEGADRETAVETFLTQVMESVKGTNAVISICTTPEAITGENGGLTLQTMERAAKKLWLPLTGQDPETLLAGAAVKIGGDRLVDLVDQFQENRKLDQCILVK